MASQNTLALRKKNRELTPVATVIYEGGPVPVEKRRVILRVKTGKRYFGDRTLGILF